MIKRRTIVKRGKNTSKSKVRYLFQKKSEISKNCFDIDLDCIEDNFMTKKSNFFKRMSQRNIKGQAVKLLKFLFLL